MIRPISAALALTLALTVGTVASSPQPAAAAPAAVHSAVPDRQPDGATFEWHGSNLKSWTGTHFFGVGAYGSGQDFTAPAGSLAFRMEYPGVIESVVVRDGVWKVESQDSNSFTVTNSQPVAIRFGVYHNTNHIPLSNIQVSGQFDRNFVVGSMVRGSSALGIYSNARVS